MTERQDIDDARVALAESDDVANLQPVADLVRRRWPGDPVAGMIANYVEAVKVNKRPKSKKAAQKNLHLAKLRQTNETDARKHSDWEAAFADSYALFKIMPDGSTLTESNARYICRGFDSRINKLARQLPDDWQNR
jgi:hypothetical protein